MTAAPLLELRDVSKSFRGSGGRVVQAVNSVSLIVGHGETVALVGESGSGKSTLGRIALCLMPPDRGQVMLAGTELTGMPAQRLRKARTVMQPVFQDPAGSFNPRHSVAEAMGQALRRLQRAQQSPAAVALLERVGLRPGTAYLSRMPHELSGGQRQRLAIARALAMDPILIIADEPLSGADVSIRGQVLNLLADLQEERGVAYLMITHDILVARAFADRIAVMQRGEIVEDGPAEQVLRAPRHPYTRRLIAAVPVID